MLVFKSLLFLLTCVGVRDCWGQDVCDYATGHGFLIFPASGRCNKFILSHGSAFECPHQYDLKLLVSFEDEDDQDTFCDYVQSNPNSTSNVFGGELPTYGLRMIMDGRFHHLRGPLITNFFGNMSVLLESTGLIVEHVLYGREYTADPPSNDLEYLLHVLDDLNIFVSHYIDAPPSFDHIGIVKLNVSFTHGGTYLLSFPGVPDQYGSRLQIGDAVVGRLMGSGTYIVSVTLVADLYHGEDDEFVSLLEYCPDPGRPRWKVCPSQIV